MRSRPEAWLLAWVVGCGDASGGSEGGTSTGDAESTGSSTGDVESSTGEDPTTGEPWASLDERPCPEDNTLSAENFGAPFLLTQCTGCHHSSLPASERAGAPLDTNFDALADVRAHAPRIWARAADSNATMPPLGGPPQDERTRLGQWLACGAPTAADAAGHVIGTTSITRSYVHCSPDQAISGITQSCGRTSK